MKKIIRLIWELINDILRWCFYSSTLPLNKKKNTERKIKLLIHSIEKGLCLKNVRLGFGQKKIEALQKHISNYEEMQGTQDYLVLQAKISINEYVRYHNEKGYDVSGFAQEYVIDSAMEENIETPGIEKQIRYEDDALKQMSYETLIRARHSTRNFSNREMDCEKVKQAIDIARETAPSACNRQAVKVYFIKDTELAHRILKIQGANSGFGENAQGVLILSVDLMMYAGIEKKLPLVDGGIFLNSLANSLFYKGIANCILHACIGACAEKKIRKLCNIPYYESIVGFIVLGTYEDVYWTAKSPRKPLEETYCEL